MSMPGEAQQSVMIMFSLTFSKYWTTKLCAYSQTNLGPLALIALPEAATIAPVITFIGTPSTAPNHYPTVALVAPIVLPVAPTVAPITVATPIPT
jgi:hypothetical protein